ncbi:MAG: hypothetical protein IKU72_01255 [Oscillospiraceae bacterium]|nr:hypothetical protein [Oscillospiraceae bacterium]
MTETIGISTIISEIGTKGILLSLGKSAFQLALIVGCVVLIRYIIKKMGKTKGPGVKIGWSVDEAEERKELGLEEQQDEA